MSRHLTQLSGSAISRPMRRFGVDALGYLFAQSIPALIGFLSAYAFTRLLTPLDYGVYSTVVAIVTPATVLVSEWAAQPVGRFFSEFHVTERMGLYTRLFSRLLRSVFLAAITGGALILLYGGRRWGLLIAASAAAVLMVEALMSVMLPILPASLDSRSYRGVQIGKAFLKFGLSLLFVVAFGRGAASLLWGTLLGTLSMMLPLAHRVRWHLSWGAAMGDYSPHDVGTLQIEEEDQFRRFVGYGLPMMWWFLGSQLMAVGDRYVIEAYLGNEAVGIYAATYNLIAGVSGVLSGPVTLAAFPIIARLWAEGRINETEDTISEMTAWYAALGAWLVGEVALVGEVLLAVVLGPAFRSGWVIALPVTLGLVLWNASILGHKSLELTERTKLMAMLAIVAAAFNVASNLLVVPLYGITGAAWTTLLSYLLYCLGVAFTSKRTVVRWRLPWKALGAIAVASLISCVITDSVVFAGVLGVVLQGITFTVVFLGLCSAYLVWNRNFLGAYRWGE